LKNFYHSLKTATHPCYNLIQGGYVCSCGIRNGNKKNHNKHVFENHTQSEAIHLLSSFDYKKLYKIKN
jgi:hypothetical protein